MGFPARGKSTALFVIAILSLTYFPGCSNKQDARPIRVASWGGRFQDDLVESWVKPAAERCSIQIETVPWNGEYGALTVRIEKGINDLDLVHVEAHYVKIPESRTLFEPFPERLISNVPDDLRDASAVPVLQYAYVLAYRNDSVKATRILTWQDFWDTKSFPQKRGLRDVPIGNVEIALLSLGRDLQRELYDPKLSRDQVETQVKDAFGQLDKIKPKIVWWETGDQLQRDIESGDTPLVAAWSGRVWSAHRNLCGTQNPHDCKVQISPSTALVSTDWWVIPKGAQGKLQANRLLNCMYDDSSLLGAATFSSKQGYLVPAKGIDSKISDAVAQYYLSAGSSSNHDAIRIQERFWGQHYEWILARWKEWREK